MSGSVGPMGHLRPVQECPYCRREITTSKGRLVSHGPGKRDALLCQGSGISAITAAITIRGMNKEDKK